MGQGVCTTGKVNLVRILEILEDQNTLIAVL